MSYYDTILARARAVSPNLLADDTLFQALLLALISNEKHLIVRTHEDSIARVSGQVVNVSSNIMVPSRTTKFSYAMFASRPWLPMKSMLHDLSRERL